MATKRVQQYRGFTLEIKYLPHYPDVEVVATPRGVSCACHILSES